MLLRLLGRRLMMTSKVLSITSSTKIHDLKKSFINHVNSQENLKTKAHQDRQQANSVIAQALEKYTNEELCICFDGGKDGHVVLDLLRKAVADSKTSQNKVQNVSQSQIILLNIVSEPFPECTTLVARQVDTKAESTTQNLLKLIEIHDSSMVSALTKFKTDHPKIKAIFMGTRRTDNSFAQKLDYFNQTDKNWPQFTVISPILDWDLTSVWHYLLTQEVDYCQLYDRGYTSLGHREKTVRNELLKSQDGTYLPAFCMLSVEEERSNRQK